MVGARKDTQRGLGQDEDPDAEAEEASELRAKVPQPHTCPPPSSSEPRGRCNVPRSEKTTLRRHSWNAYVVDLEDLAVPVARVTPSSCPRPVFGDISGAPLDPREAYVLALVDGKVSAGDIADMTGLPEKAVLEILQKLIALQLASLP